MPRLFVAIELPETVRDLLEPLALGLPGGRAVPREQLHLTLRFIGELEGKALRDVRGVLGEVRARPFSLTACGVGCFPRRRDPRVAWAGFRHGPELAALHRGVEAALERVGIPPEGRKLHPHVTLVRLGAPRPARVAAWLREHAMLESPPFPVTAFRLYSSLLRPSGAVHRVEERYALLGDDEPAGTDETDA